MILDAGPLIAIDRNRRALAALMSAAVEANQYCTLPKRSSLKCRRPLGGARSTNQESILTSDVGDFSALAEHARIGVVRWQE